MVAELTESPKGIYPPLASVLSAFGTLVTPVRIERAADPRKLRSTCDILALF
ncbi:hypothetical protein [Pseudooceanicola spongiae]|uniref:Uncharacterized protein n=1 Tax=Pseudooceanicola spongiae TaxID=2613965 RepID=A0A7L9WHP7_9RHOB|nr:hypothetical protein [Pseudooceanicola spongiae]QOL79911.1 hypothetical protein F3W81_03180 [Pseudooceanicola spongiae]